MCLDEGFDFRNRGPKAIVDRLREVAAAEAITVEDDALALIARIARGGMRDALSMFDQIVVFGDGAVTTRGVHEALGLIDDDSYAELLSMIAERRTTDVFGFVARLVEQGADLAEFVGGTVSMAFWIMEKTEGSRVFILLCTSRHTTPSPMSHRLAELFFASGSFANLMSESRRTPSSRVTSPCSPVSARD